MDKKKKDVLNKAALILLSASLIFLIAVPIVKVMTSSYSVIIKDKDLNFFRGGNLFICGNTIIVKRDSETVKNKTSLPEPDAGRFYYTILSMKNIISIEIFQEEEIIEADISPVPPQYLGRYKIRLQGHEGILVIGASKDRLYGSVRFPGWGKGAVEYLKGVRISSGGVRFTRSASTAEEIRRLGANYLFKHNFSGRYNSSGKVIKGIMINNRGERFEWEAEKK
jgi:hypothetical protein